MLHDDPFESWLLRRKMNWLPSQALTQQQDKVSAALDRLVAFLDNSPPKRTLSDLGLWREIGDLGLVRKHKFLYYFDYGDSHKFEVEVVGIHPDIQQGKYPRVVESKGKAPAQYSWEDEDNDEWEDK